MKLSSDLISQFVKVTNDSAKNKTEKTVYGTTVEQDGRMCVRFDGSTIPTPVKYAANIGPGERVIVQIKNHTATVIGNLTSPSARIITHDDGRKTVEDIDVSEFGGLGERVLIVEQLVADKVSSDVVEAISGRIDTLSAEHVTINGKIAANEGDISELQADNVSIKERLTAAEAIIEEIDTENLDAKYAKIKDLEATNADIYNLEATYAEFVKTTTESLEADKADIKDLKADNVTISGKLVTNEADISDLKADNVTITGKLTAAEGNISKLSTDKLDATAADIKYATIENLNAQKGRIDDLSVNKLDASSAIITNLQAEVADIDTLIFGSASGSTIQTSFANSVIAQLGNAQIKSAMIESVSASKITAGDIITNNVQVKSSDGKLLISDETIQISDDTRVRVQIGKDAANDYSINIWDESGKLMFSKGGITDAAIKEAIIRNDMVSDTANISASKLDIDSLFEEVNGSSKTIKSSKVLLDEKNQTLDVAFTSMTNSVTTVTETANTAIANAAKAQSDVDNLEIGGKNLLLDSGVEVSNNEYLVYGYVPSSPLIEGEQYTVSMCVTPASGVSHLTLYLSGGSSPRVTLWPSGTDRQILTDVFTAGYYPGYTPDVNIYYANANIYRFPNDGTVNGNTTIHWIKIEKGNKATDWTPAPEDVENEIGSVSDRVTSQGTQISVIQGQIASKIWQQDFETVVDGITVGGRNLLLDSSKISNYIPATGITVSTHADGYLQVAAAASNGNYVPFYCNERDYTIAETSLSEGDEFVLSFTMRSPDSTLIPAVYIKSGMGYYDLKGRMSSEWSTVWYAGIWQDANPIDFHLGFSGRPGTYEIKNVKLEKGNKATDWTPAPEDVDGAVTTLNTKYSELKQSADGVALIVAGHTTELTNKAGKGEVTAVSDRVTSVEANLEGFKSTVSSTYTTKDELDDLEADVDGDISDLSGRMEQAETRIDQKADSITLSAYASKTDLQNSMDAVQQWKSAQEIDLRDTSVYSESKWYPVAGTAMNAAYYHYIQVYAALFNESKPSWCTHYSGFTVDFGVKTKAGGWGATTMDTTILEDEYRWVKDGESSPVSYDQCSASSQPILWLRGGGYYRVRTDYECSWTPYPGGYTWQSGQYAYAFHVSSFRPTPLGDHVASDEETKASLTVLSNRITSNVTETDGLKSRTSTLEQRADGFTVSLNETNTKADNAAKTATNFLSYDATNGLQVGNKSSGSWSGYRTQIKSDAFNILDEDGMVCASYGKDLIELGKGNRDAVIDLCGGAGVISTYHGFGVFDRLDITSDAIRIGAITDNSSQHNTASLYAAYGNDYDSDNNRIFERYAQVESNGYWGVNISHKRLDPDTGNYSGSYIELQDYHVALIGGNAGISFGSSSNSIRTMTIYSNDTDVYIYSGGGDVSISASLGKVNLSARDRIAMDVPLYISTAEKTAYNDGAAGWYLGTDGTAHITHATGGSGIYFHYSGSYNTTSLIQETASGTISINGVKFSSNKINGMMFGTNKVMWVGAYWMQGSQQIHLSGQINEQAHGIVLIFSGYNATSQNAENYNWNSHFIPKELVSSAPGGGHTFMMSDNGSFGQFAIKYLYIGNTDISGHDNNKAYGTGFCGITYDNRNYVLRYVIGV